MSLSIIDIAEGVAELINSPEARTHLDNAGFSDDAYDFEAVVKFKPELVLKDDVGLVVFVMTQGKSTEFNRTFDTKERRINVAVERKVQNPETETPQLVKFCEALDDFLSNKQQRSLEFTSGGKAMLKRIATNQLWVPEHLRDADQFTSVKTLTYFSQE